MAYDEKTAGRVRNALSGRRDVVEKNLMGGLCFMTKGGMCCSVSGGGGGCWCAWRSRRWIACCWSRTSRRWKWAAA